MLLTTTVGARTSSTIVFEFSKDTNPAEVLPSSFAEVDGQPPCLMSTFTCNGETFTVTSKLKPGETPEEFVERHFKDVRAKIRECCQ